MRSKSNFVHADVPDVILFDWDNTLIDSWNTIHAALSETFIKMGHAPWSLEETKQRVQHSLRDSFPSLFGEHWQDAAQTFYKSFEKLHLKKLKPMPYAEEMLSSVLRIVPILGVISNKTGVYLRKEVVHLNWCDYFVDVIGAGDAEKDKPNSAPVNLFRKNNLSKNEQVIWYVGDSEIDIATANSSGCVSILINDQNARRNIPDKIFSELEFSDCRELATFLKNL